MMDVLWKKMKTGRRPRRGVDPSMKGQDGFAEKVVFKISAG